jgi:preprotein translocase subunit YajC
MHLQLSLPAHVAELPAFANAPFAGASMYDAALGAMPATPTTEPSADEDDDSSSTAAGIFNIAILLLIPVGMYFLLIRPQRRRRQEAQKLQSSIGVGDEIVTTSGVYGFITAVEEDTGIIWLEVDDDVQIRISRAAISGKVSATAATTAPADAAADVPAAETDEVTAGEPAPSPATGTPSRPSLKGGTKESQSNGTGSSEPGTE